MALGGTDPDPDARRYVAMLGDPDRHVAGLLGLAGLEASRDRFHAAARHADRARRLDPTNPILADLYARLQLRLGDPAEALRALRLSRAGDVSATSGVLLAQCLLAAGDIAGAARETEAVAIAFAVDAAPDLGAVAAAICRQGSGTPPGWVGLASDGSVRGALWPDLTPFRRALSPGARREFARALPPGMLGARSLLAAPSWRLSARVRRRGDALCGAASFGWAPETPVTVVATDAAGRERWSTTTAKTRRNGAIGHAISLSLAGLRLDRPPRFEAITPDGERIPLAAGPPPLGVGRPSSPRRAGTTAAVSVIVPVYDGRDDTLACLRSVLATTDPGETEVIVVDDDSPDPALKADLARLAADGRITLLINPDNRGFPHSANRGLALRPDRDAVLLNADTEVYGDWLRRLRAAADAAPEIATVTPFSNNGSMMAYPSSDAAPIDSARGARSDAAFRRLNAGRRLDLPTGAGFCLYIKRACLDEVGLFDEAAFGRGYGEENDFCLRAAAAGWRHLGAADVFVRHVGGRSFGALKSVLTAHNLKILYRRHRGYRREAARFLQTDAAAPVRRAVDEALLAAEPRPSTLLLTLARGGGVEHHVARRTQALTAEGRRVIELRPAAAEAAGGVCRLVVAGEDYDDLTYRLPAELDDLTGLLTRLGIGRVEIHHGVGLDRSAIKLATRLGAPYDVYIHDYSWICPRITLISGGADYCGEPDLSACEVCVATHGDLIEEVITVADLRARTGTLMTGAARVIAPTDDVARRMRRYVPRLDPVVSPWEGAPDALAPPRRAPEQGPVRVAVLGSIGQHKGYDRLLACARDARRRNLPLTFVVIGHTEDDAPLFETGRVFVTGPYDEGEAADLLAREACDVALSASVWPETWCYTLTHLLRSGLPLVAFDLGAMAERLSAVPRATLLPLRTDAAGLNAALIAAAGPRVNAEVRTAQGAAGRPWIEGLRLQLSGVASPGNIEYAAVLAGDSTTGWRWNGAWCGDPSGARPVLGMAARLSGDIAGSHRCRYSCAFSSGLRSEAVDGAPARSPWPNDPLVAIDVALEAIR